MKAVLAAALALTASASAALAAQIEVERFAAVKIVSGQGVAAVVSNVLPTGTAVQPCFVSIAFFAGDSSRIGPTSRTVSLSPGHSASVPAPSPPPGLVRALVGVGNPGDCAVRTQVEVYDTATHAVRLIMPSNDCLGNHACATPIP
ncbi:MAG TPA: hypothetical protein VGF34_17015 [Stellaceae bacterium]|jgi:hypothetical protein